MDENLWNIVSGHTQSNLKTSLRCYITGCSGSRQWEKKNRQTIDFSFTGARCNIKWTYKQHIHNIQRPIENKIIQLLYKSQFVERQNWILKFVCGDLWVEICRVWKTCKLKFENAFWRFGSGEDIVGPKKWILKCFWRSRSDVEFVEPINWISNFEIALWWSWSVDV